jgi:hypothetical protein
MSFKVKAAFAACCVSIATSAFANHVPGSAEVINYDSPLANGQTATGFISNTVAPRDGYDWYCVTGTAGTQISATATRTSGDLLPNIGYLSGVTTSGTSIAASGLASQGTSNNSGNANVTFTFTPTTSGPVTIYVSTWTAESGDYTLTVNGVSATAPTCAPAQPLASAPTNVPTLGLIPLMGLAFGVAGFGVVLQRRTRSRKD